MGTCSPARPATIKHVRENSCGCVLKFASGIALYTVRNDTMEIQELLYMCRDQSFSSQRKKVRTFVSDSKKYNKVMALRLPTGDGFAYLWSVPGTRERK